MRLDGVSMWPVADVGRNLRFRWQASSATDIAVIALVCIAMKPVIPRRAKREPGIHRSASDVEKWIPGLRQRARPGMTTGTANVQDGRLPSVA